MKYSIIRLNVYCERFLSCQNASSLCNCASLFLYMVTKNDFDSLLALRGYHVILVQCATGI